MIRIFPIFHLDLGVGEGGGGVGGVFEQYKILHCVHTTKINNDETSSLLLDVVITHTVTFVLQSAVLSDLGQSNSLVMLLNVPDPRRGQ